MGRAGYWLGRAHEALGHEAEAAEARAQVEALSNDPANRTLLKISMEDLGAADELFRVLMGDNVEPRRDFIQKHALDVKNLDV